MEPYGRYQVGAVRGAGDPGNCGIVPSPRKTERGLGAVHGDSQLRGPKSETTQRARILRQSDNDAEAKLWSELRDHRLNGLKFVRQHPVGPYFADFACRERLLVVEVDGASHINNFRDRRRDALMNNEGWSVVRFRNADVLRVTPSILATILAVCDGRLVDAVETSDLRFAPAPRFYASMFADSLKPLTPTLSPF